VPSDDERCECSAIFDSHRPPGGEFAGRAQLSPKGVEFYEPTLAADRAGNVLGVWNVRVGDGGSIRGYVQGRLVAADGALGPRRRISRRRLGVSSEQAALASSGAATVAWMRLERTKSRIEMTRVRMR
jgi:hypothetical protein